MVAKIHSGKGAYGSLKYNFDKVKLDVASILSTENCFSKGLYNDDFACTIRDMMNTFQVNLSQNNRTENVVFTASLNPSVEDLERLTDDDYRNIANDYMREMGYGEQPYIVFKHNDIERTHIHIVTIRVDKNGDKIDSNFEKVKSNRVRKQLEEKYNLTPAEKQKKNYKELKKEQIATLNSYLQNAKEQIYLGSFSSIEYGKNELVQQMRNVLRYVQPYGVNNLQSYNKVLSQFGVRCEVLEGESKGGKYSGLIYYAIDSNGNQISQSFKSSLFGKQFTLKVLEQRFNKGVHLERKSKAAFINNIEFALKTSKTSIERFQESLSRNGITALIIHNVEGRITGVSYIDNYSKLVLNGSDLSKSCSANALNAVLKLQTAESKQIADDNKIISALLSKHYNEVKKTNPTYFFESALIKGLPDLENSLVQMVALISTDIPVEQIQEQVRLFVLNKQSKLENIQEKEIKYFEQVLEDTLYYSQSITPDKRMDFLKRMDISITKDENDTILFQHTNGILSVPASKFVDQESLSMLLRDEITHNKRFTRLDKLSFRALQTNNWGKINFKSINPNMQVFEFLTKEQSTTLLRKMTQDVINNIYDNGVGGMHNVENLFNRGFIIHPLKSRNTGDIDYYIGNYRQPKETYIKIDNTQIIEDLVKYNYATNLYPHRMKYNFDRSSRPTPKYTSLVNLYIANDTNNVKLVDQTINYIQKANLPLAISMKKFIKEGDVDFNSLIKLLDSMPKNLQNKGLKI